MYKARRKCSECTTRRARKTSFRKFGPVFAMAEEQNRLQLKEAEPRPRQQESRLLNLPAELRNSIYDYVAASSKEVVVYAHDLVLSRPAPLVQTSYQLREEFGPVHDSLPMSHATKITIHNINFSIWDLILSLQRVPKPASGVARNVVFRVSLSNGLKTQDLQAFVKQLTESIYSARASAMTKLDIVFDPAKTDLNYHRLVFARLARQYRFHCSDEEQRIWEKIYWSFAEAAEEADGVSVKEYALGALKMKGGGFAFV